MIRITFWFVVLAALAAGAVLVADQPGTINMVWQGQHIELSVSAGLFIFFIAAAAVAGLILLVLKLRPSALLKAKRANDREKGWQALAQGLIAVAAGNAPEAKKLARLAENKLKDPGKTLLLTAQASQISGNAEKAAASFAAMLETPETELLGLKGLLADASRLDDAERAYPLAKRAVEIAPKTPWALEALFMLAARKGEWDEALSALQKAEKAKVLTGPERRRREAVMHAAAAEYAEEKGDKAMALDHGEQAFKRDMALPSNTARLGRLLFYSGKARRARKILSQGFAAFPHPEIADAMNLIVRAEGPAERRKAIEGMIANRADSVDARLALADAAIAAQAWQKARDHLAEIPATVRTAKAWSLAADLARQGDGDAAAAREALMQAAAAPRDAQWVCSSCGRRAAEWDAICPTCHTVDAAEWRSDMKPAMAMPTAAAPAQIVNIAPEKSSVTVTPVEDGLEVQPAQTPRPQPDKYITDVEDASLARTSPKADDREAVTDENDPQMIARQTP